MIEKKSGFPGVIVKVRAGLLVPPAVVTVTLADPVMAFEAILKVAVISVPLTTLTLLTVTPLLLTFTLAPETKFVPVRVTGIAVPWAPLMGLRALSVGTGGLTVKVLDPLVPPAVVTVTL